MRLLTGAIALFLTAGWLTPGRSAPQASPQTSARRTPAARTPTVAADPPVIKASEPSEKLTYAIEWRLIRAGDVVVEAQKSRAHVRIDSAGMVSTLFKVEDAYTVNYDDPYCAVASHMDSQEGKRHRETIISYDRNQGRAEYVERDLIANTVLREAQVEIPRCVHDVLGAFLTLRGVPLEPGNSVQLPVTDGRKEAPVKVEAQEREQVETPSGDFKTIRCEAYLLNGVVYGRKGRVFVWFTDDARRMPVQIRLRMNFPIGTVTLQLAKEERL